MKKTSEKIIEFFKKKYLWIKPRYGFCAIGIFLIALILINRNLFISNPYIIMIDPWLYTGYFLNLKLYYKMFGVLYYGTRFSWIIPGYILYSLFPTLTANYLLHFGFVAAAVLSLYYTLKNTISDRIGIFTSLLFGGYIYFLNEMGYDYISGAVITFFLLTILFLTISTKSRNRKYYLFLAGIFCISMIYANLFAIIFLPTLIAFLIFIHLYKHKFPIIPTISYFIFGIFAGSAVMEVFAYLSTGKMLVILEQVNIASYYNSISNPWGLSLEKWIVNASWLLLPLIIVIGCILFLILQRSILRKKNSKYSYGWFFTLNFLATILIFLGLQIKGNPVFQVSYYACYLIPPMFLAIGAICSGMLDSLPPRQYYFILIFEMCLLLVPYTAIDSIIKSVILQLGSTFFLLVFAICWIIFIFFSSITRKIPISSISTLIILLAVISLCLFNGLLYFSQIKIIPVITRMAL